MRVPSIAHGDERVQPCKTRLFLARGFSTCQRDGSILPDVALFARGTKELHTHIYPRGGEKREAVV